MTWFQLLPLQRIKSRTQPRPRGTQLHADPQTPDSSPEPNNTFHNLVLIFPLHRRPSHCEPDMAPTTPVSAGLARVCTLEAIAASFPASIKPGEGKCRSKNAPEPLCVPIPCCLNDSGFLVYSPRPCLACRLRTRARRPLSWVCQNTLHFAMEELAMQHGSTSQGVVSLCYKTLHSLTTVKRC